MADIVDSSVGSIWEAVAAAWDYVTSDESSDDADEAQAPTTVVNTERTCTEYVTDGFRPVVQVTVPCSSNSSASSIWSDVKDVLIKLGSTQKNWRR